MPLAFYQRLGFIRRNDMKSGSFENRLASPSIIIGRLHGLEQFRCMHRGAAP
jgi:hypothetical protein